MHAVSAPPAAADVLAPVAAGAELAGLLAEPLDPPLSLLPQADSAKAATAHTTVTPVRIAVKTIIPLIDGLRPGVRECGHRMPGHVPGNSLSAAAVPSLTGSLSDPLLRAKLTTP